MKTLEEVLKRLEAAGVRLKEEKCAFLLPDMEYLGHKISRKGLQPTQEKIRVIIDAPLPKDISQLKSFLGIMGSFYPTFQPS